MPLAVPGHDQPYALSVGDGAVVRGTLREVSPIAPLIVLAHCFGGSSNHWLMRSAAEVLARRQVSTLRINFYGWGEGERRLLDTTMSTHVADLAAVLADCRVTNPNRALVVAGHSFGGLVPLLLGDDPMDGLAMWETSHADSWGRELGNLADPVPGTELHAMTAGSTTLVTRAYLESVASLDCDALANRFTKPALVARASANEFLYEYGARYAANLGGEVAFVDVPGADHHFTVEGVVEVLGQKTAAWAHQLNRAFAPPHVPTLSASGPVTIAALSHHLQSVGL